MDDIKTMKVKRMLHYGRETLIPEDDLSRKFADLLEQKTLTRQDIEKIKELGYRIVTIGEEL